MICKHCHVPIRKLNQYWYDSELYTTCRTKIPLLHEPNSKEDNVRRIIKDVDNETIRINVTL